MGRDGRLRYHVGVVFARLVDLKPHEVRPPEQEAAPVPVIIPPVAPDAATELAVEAVSFEPPDVPTADDPSSIDFEVSFPSEEEVVRNRW
jgi:hypothetical protein